MGATNNTTLLIFGCVLNLLSDELLMGLTLLRCKVVLLYFVSEALQQASTEALGTVESTSLSLGSVSSRISSLSLLAIKIYVR